jgi:UDP-N-acetylglucosamine 2-epimerase (non-hydrolysing)
MNQTNTKKTIVSIVGIRPDFIRMSKIFKLLDESFNHILIHTGQHFDKNLSTIYFEQLDIKSPDFNLEIGGKGKEHFHQTAELSVKIIELFREKNIKPDLILFLGDSNSVLVSTILKKEGYKIAHIEAGMRSGDKRMLEEINRIVCDHCSDYLFTYHKNYKKKLIKENIDKNSIHVVGNTIVEVCHEFSKNIIKTKKKNNFILLDIHRPENFKYKDRMEWIINYANLCFEQYKKPIKMLNFKRTISNINLFNLKLGNIEIIDLMNYQDYLNFIYHCKFIISDSGTSQEEPALLKTKVIVPRDFTERPESVKNNCSFMLNDKNFKDSFLWIDSGLKIKTEWMGNGKTAEKIISIIKAKL